MGRGKRQLRAKFEITSHSRYINIIREPKILESSPRPKPPPLFPACDFMICHGKPKLYTKFEVDSFSHCVYIEGKPRNFVEFRL